MQRLLSKSWHHLPEAEILQLLEADPDNGLSLTEVSSRVQHFGPNVLTPRRGAGPVVRLLLQFHQPLIYILVVAGLVTAGLGEWVDSSVILGVVLINGIVGFLQESKAIRAMEALVRMMIAESTVVRGGEVRKISSHDVVPGDVVLLHSGDKVPADLRLVYARDLQIDESTLTGESVSVGKRTGSLARDTVLADRRNMAYASTLVTYGHGKGVVVATGDETEVGRISQLIAQAQDIKTPLTRKIAGFSRVLLYVIMVLAVFTFGVGVIKGQGVLDMFMASVALAVAAIPEGLPAAVTIILAIGVARMSWRRAIVRKLPAVETLGSTTVICTDKTGTLTENQMTVREISVGSALYEVTGAGYAPEGQILGQKTAVDRTAHPALFECLRCGVLCNDALLVEEEGRWKIQGDPTEGALIVSAHKVGLSHETENDRLPRVEAIPFESLHQYMATLHACGRGQLALAYVKGAVEVLVERCSTALGVDGQLADVDHDSILNAAESMARKGLRVLAFARKQLPAGTTELNHTDVGKGLTFIGLQGMIDPPRPEAIEAVDKCKKAGIRIKMITGDHAKTAAVIAREMGIDGDRTNEGLLPHVLGGKALAGVSDADLVEVAQHTNIFARVTPEQKLRLVKALQQRGEIVAMTGDGVNDAPALKQANIGVAMGRSGTEVAKEAADMVLTDDNFATIEAAVEEGRGVFDNLTKFIVWTLPTNAGEGLVVLAAILTGAMLPLMPVHILWINMATAVFLGMMLAFEPTERDIMARPPRDPQTPILTGALITRMGLVTLLMLCGAFGLFKWERINGAPIDVARTVAVNVFVVIEMCYLFNCRSLTKSMFAVGVVSNRWLLGGVAGMLALQVGFTYTPFMNRFIHSAPIPPVAWLRIVAVGVAVYLFVGLEKWVRRRLAMAGTASITRPQHERAGGYINLSRRNTTV